ncbi:hypothetical protein Q9R19_10320 [Microbacterium sp. ARD32]|uniref:hypothetical protein n=1 Tax=Microbacterium sp. ARD32 TaxID=2962577 RepID=UPI0028811EAC|nr:hypothetical protein [Microbacterium sp. ARD32]MDT0158018.1 hypothetical protein [Microbacterium sp. ARD32]
MTQQDLFFMVIVVIGLGSLSLLTMQLLKRPRRDDRGEWYRGPWDDDDRRPRGPGNPRDPRNPRGKR